MGSVIRLELGAVQGGGEVVRQGARCLLRLWLVVAFVACSTAPVFAWRGEVDGREVEIGGYVETRQVFRIDRATEHELNLQRVQIEARAWLHEQLSFDLVTSLQNGGPATRSTRSGFYDIDNVFQSVAPAVEIEEASLRLNVDSFEFRVGQIKHSWGKLDRYQPNDEINPERYSDPILLDESDRKIGVPSIEATFHLPESDWTPEESAFTVVIVPRYVPFRVSQPGERWFPPNAVPPASIPIRLSEDETVDVPLSLEARNAAPPSFSPSNASYAARFAAHWSGLDYALYYYHGIQTSPVFDLNARADVVATAPGVTGTTILSPVFQPIQMWGGDLAFTLGQFGIRAEVAYTHDRAFNRDLRSLLGDPALDAAVQQALEELNAGASSAAVDIGETFSISDSVQWGVGVDTAISDFDLLFELSQTHVLDNQLPLLIEDDETVLLADVRRGFLRDDLTLQMVSVYGATSDYTVLMPRVTYRLYDRFEIRLGYLHIAGRTGSRLGQFKNNDEAFVRLRLYL